MPAVCTIPRDARGNGLRAEAALERGVELLFLRNFRAFFAGFGEADGNGLLPALHLASFTAFARAERAALFPAHGSFN